MDPGLYDQVAKALAHRPRLLAIVRGDFLPPASVKIELTSVCNQGCHFCAYRRLTKDGPATSLETSRVLRLIDELAAHGTEGVMFTGGGEPLAHPEFASILAQCSRSGMQAALLTNGALLGKIGDEALRALRGLRFSINAGTAAEYAQVHQTSDSDWTRVWEQVVRVSDKTRFPRLSVGVSFVVTSRNVGSIAQLGQRAKQSGADYVHVRPAFIGPHTVLERTLSSEETATSLTQIEALQTLEDERFRVHGIVRRFHELEPARRRRSHCRATPLVAYVLPGGEVTLCTLVRERGFMPGLDDPFLGSLREASFFDLWNTPRHHDLIGRLSQAGCERCHFDQYNRALELVESDAIHAAFL